MSSRVNPIAHLQNNTADWWWKDKGLRKLSLDIAVGFASSVAGGGYFVNDMDMPC
jgi:hypothetical protein